MGFLIGIILGVLSYVASVVFSVVVSLTTAVGSLIGAIGGIVGMVAKTIGQAVAPPINALSGLAARTAATVKTMTRNLITGFADTVGNVTKPVLEPIRDALVGVRNATQGIETWIKTTLRPLEQVIGAVEEISGYFMIYKTLANIRNISDGLDVVAKRVGLETAAKIAELTRQIVDIGTSVVDYVQDTFTAFDRKVVHADERIREANRIGLAELRAAVDEKFIKIRADLDLNVRRFDRDLVRIERRVEDLPHFMGMMIRALR